MKKRQNVSIAESGKLDAELWPNDNEGTAKNISTDAEDEYTGAHDRKSEDGDDDGCDYSIIDVDDAWPNVYYLLKQGGWSHCSGDITEPYFYLAPGCKKVSAVFGEGIFRNSEVMIYIRKQKKTKVIGVCTHCRTKIYEDVNVHRAIVENIMSVNNKKKWSYSGKKMLKMTVKGNN